jgi:hypothetical protein
MMIGVLLSSQGTRELLGIRTTEHRLPGGDTYGALRAWKYYAILCASSRRLIAVLAVTAGLV